MVAQSLKLWTLNVRNMFNVTVNQTAKSEKLEFHPIKPSFQDLFPWDYQFNAFAVLMSAILENVFVFRTLDLGAEN